MIGFAQPSYLPTPSGKVVLGSFQIEGQPRQGRVIHNGGKGIETDMPFAQLLVTIFMGITRILRIVQVQSPQSRQSDHAIELLQHAIQVGRYVVAPIPYMAGIQANTQVVVEFHLIDDSGDLLEAPPHFRPFARHGLQQHGGGLVGRQSGVECCGDLVDSCFSALTGMGARVHVVQLAGHDLLHALQIPRQRLQRELARLLLGGAGVHGIGRMG